MRALMIAFSMYSKIPMPKVEWSEKPMKYAMCFFPLVGLVIGGVMILEYYFLEYLKIGTMLRTSILVVTPLILTGGIHVDGFLDTLDARNSYQEKERKLKILSDPHVGAFAVIGMVIYYILTFGLMSELTEKGVWIAALGYGYTRALSGFGVVTLKCAKTDGLAAVFSKGAERKTVRAVMVLYSLLLTAMMMAISPGKGIAVLLLGLLVFAGYRRMAYREFGGITGDLAGYFVTVCELFILAAAVLVCR